MILYLWLLGHEGCPFVFHYPFFKKVASTGLNSLRQKGCQILVKNWTFDDPFHKKQQVLVILVPGTIRISNFFDEMRLSRSLRPLRLLRPLRSLRPQKFKAWKITTEDFRVIQAFEFSFIFMF